MKKILKRLTGFILIGFILVLFISFLIHQERLQNFSKQLFSYSSPPETEMVEKHTSYGHLIGNGNHVSYLAVLLIRSNLSVQELETYYKQVNFKTAVSNRQIAKLIKWYGKDLILKSKDQNGKFPIALYVNKAESPIMKLDGQEIYQNFTFKSLENVSDFSDYYYVILYDDGYPPSLNLKLLACFFKTH